MSDLPLGHMGLESGVSACSHAMRRGAFAAPEAPGAPPLLLGRTAGPCITALMRVFDSSVLLPLLFLGGSTRGLL